jgi:hypothetical protein
MKRKQIWTERKQIRLGEDQPHQQSTSKRKKTLASWSPSKKTVQRRIGADPRRGNGEEVHRKRPPPLRTPYFNTTVGISQDWVEKQGRRRVGAQHWAAAYKGGNFHRWREHARRFQHSCASPHEPLVTAEISPKSPARSHAAP